MAMKWEQVTKTPDYVSADSDMREAMRNRYFEEIVAPSIPTEHLSAIRTEFDSDTAPSAWKSIKSALTPNDAMLKDDTVKPAASRGVTVEPSEEIMEGSIADTGRGTAIALQKGIETTKAGFGTYLQAPRAWARSAIEGVNAASLRAARNIEEYNAQQSAELGISPVRGRGVTQERVDEAARSAQRAEGEAIVRRQQNIDADYGLAVRGKRMETEGRAGERDAATASAMYAPEMEAAAKYVEEGEGFGDTLNRAVTHPTALLKMGAESMAPTLGGLLAAKLVGTAVKLTAGAIPAQRAASLTGVASEASTAALSAREGVFNAVEQVPFDTLAKNSSRFNELVAQFGDNQKARTTLANELASQAPVISAIGTAAGTLLANKLYGGDATAKALMGKEQVSLLETGKRISQEGAEGLAQSPGDEVANYAAVSQADPNAKLDLGKAAALGALTEAGMGAGGHGSNYVRGKIAANGEPDLPSGGQPIQQGIPPSAPTPDNIPARASPVSALLGAVEPELPVPSGPLGRAAQTAAANGITPLEAPNAPLSEPSQPNNLAGQYAANGTSGPVGEAGARPATAADGNIPVSGGMAATGPGQASDAITDTAGQAGGVQSADVAPKSLVNPADYVAETYAQKAKAQGLSEVQARRLAPSPEVDPLTGLYNDAELIPALKRAQKSGENLRYVESDTFNLSGMNSALGANARADTVLKEMAEAYKKAFEGAIVFKRPAGKFAAIVPDGFDIQSAIDKATKEVQGIVAKHGLSDITAKKSPGAKGVSLHSAYSTIGGTRIEDIIGKTQAQIKAAMPKENENGERRAAFEAWLGASNGQARRAKGSVEAALRQNKGGRQGGRAAASQGLAGALPGRKVRRAIGNVGKFLSPEQYQARQYDALAKELGLTPAQKKEFKPSISKDKLTGWHTAQDLNPTIERAKQLLASEGIQSSLVIVDISNLGGMTEALGYDVADEIFRNMASIVHEESSAIGDVDVTAFRHGGDEIGFVVTGSTDDIVKAAMTKAAADVQRYVNAIGVSDLPHGKYLGKTEKYGSGVYIGVAKIKKGDRFTPERIREEADALMEESKANGKIDVKGEAMALEGVEDSKKQEEAKPETSNITPLIEQLIRRRKIAGQLGMMPQIETAIINAKAYSKGKDIKPAVFIKAAKAFKNKDAEISAALLEIANIIEPAAKVAKKPAAPSHNLLSRLRQLHVNISHMKDITGESNVQKSGTVGIFTKDGRGLDDLATTLADEGFPIDMTDENDNGGVNQLTELIRQAIGGQSVLTHAAQDMALSATEEMAHKDEIRRQAEDRDIKTVGRKFEDVEKDVLAAMEAEQGTNEGKITDAEYAAFDELMMELQDIDDAISSKLYADITEEYTGKPEKDYYAALVKQFTEAINEYNKTKSAVQAEVAITSQPEQDNQTGGREVGAGEAAAEPGFALASQTSEELAAQEQARRADIEADVRAEAARAKEARDTAEKERQKANTESGAAAAAFSLSQTEPVSKAEQKKADKAKGKAELEGQVDIFSQPAAKTEQKPAAILPTEKQATSTIIAIADIPAGLKITIEKITDGVTKRKSVTARKAMLVANQNVEKLQALKLCLQG
jgi:diguanylate cyclase (GGDEF)-like protein